MKRISIFTTNSFSLLSDSCQIVQLVSCREGGVSLKGGDNMTQTQVSYLQNLETKRHNLAMEEVAKQEAEAKQMSAEAAQTSAEAAKTTAGSNVARAITGGAASLLGLPAAVRAALKAFSSKKKAASASKTAAGVAKAATAGKAIAGAVKGAAGPAGAVVAGVSLAAALNAKIADNRIKVAEEEAAKYGVSNLAEILTAQDKRKLKRVLLSRQPAPVVRGAVRQILESHGYERRQS